MSGRRQKHSAPAGKEGGDTAVYATSSVPGWPIGWFSNCSTQVVEYQLQVFLLNILSATLRWDQLGSLRKLLGHVEAACH